jgi:O-methyltransferase involved in polyketide biosynthesis
MSDETPRGSDSISPTAEYTAYVWARNGMSHPALSTLTGRALYESLRGPMMASRLVGGPTIEGFLLARHRLIDLLLAEAIDEGRIAQVLEIACGMSPRGWRFAERYGGRITYVEADLPAMAERKRSALAAMGSLSEHHRVEDVDALADDGPASLPAVAGRLDPERGLAVISEGLVHYLDPDGLAGLWLRIAAALRGFGHGVYFADFHLESESGGVRAEAFRLALSAFVRSRVHAHFETETEISAALSSVGFAWARLHSPLDFADRIEIDEHGAGLVRVIEAGSAPEPA